MRTIKLITAVLFIGIAISACKPASINMIGYWVNRDKPKQTQKRSLFIMALTADLNARSVIESDLKATAIANGNKATTSIDELGPMNVGKNFPADAIIHKVKELKYDAILTVAVKDVKTESHFVQASDNYYNPMGMYGGAYGNFGSYYGNYWGAPGIMIGTGGGMNSSYTYDKTTYFLESNLYETATQDLLMSVQTKAVDPPTITKASKEFCAKLIELIKDQQKLEKELK